MRTFLDEKWKLGHLIGLVPTKDDLKFAAWDMKDLIIMSWLWNSMQLEMGIWEVVRQTYFKIQNAFKFMRERPKLKPSSKVIYLLLSVSIQWKACDWITLL